MTTESTDPPPDSTPAPGPKVIQIKHRWTGAVLFECEGENIKQAVVAAVAAKANLRGSNLSLSDLSGSNLSGSNLRGSNLSGSDLRGSDLRGSNLRGSNLRGSDLRGSDLSLSDLSGSNLSLSDLSGSNLSGSDLRGSNLRGSNLSGSNLSLSNLDAIKADFLRELLKVPAEIHAVREAIVQGRIDGSCYEGECACFAGTIAKATSYPSFSDFRAARLIGIDSESPRERWFLAISPGDTPENSQVAAITLGWIDEALATLATVPAAAE